MDKEQALQIIKQACASIVANLETHTRVQEAIQVVENELKGNHTVASNTTED